MIFLSFFLFLRWQSKERSNESGICFLNHNTNSFGRHFIRLIISKERINKPDDKSLKIILKHYCEMQWR